MLSKLFKNDIVDGHLLENTDTYEVERKFLLKYLPESINTSTYEHITQYYLSNLDGISERVRNTHKISNGTIIKNKYTKTTKIRQNELANKEIEIDISAKKFNEIKNKSKYLIEKKRYYLNEGENKWSIDVFVNINLVMAEIEFISTLDKLEDTMRKIRSLNIPNIISDVMVMEVTDIKAFSNKRLATLKK